MKAEIRVLCCIGLVLAPTLVGAIGWVGSKENIPSKRPAPNEMSQASSAHVTLAKAGASTDAEIRGSTSPGKDAIPEPLPSLNHDPLAPLSGEAAGSGSAAKRPAVSLPRPGSPLTATNPSGGAGLKARQEKDAPPPIPPSASSSAPVSPSKHPSGETATSKSTDEQSLHPLPPLTLNRVDGGSQLPPPSSVAQTAPGGMAESDLAGHTGQQNITGKESSVGQAQPPKEKSLANRFLDQPPVNVFNADQLSWDAADCGCVPALLTVETYGFYPFWDKKDVGPLNFGIWSRIGYYALTPDEAGHVQAPAGWMGSHGNKKAAPIPHRYGTKVDLVIRNNKWAALSSEDGKGLALDTTYVLLELMDNVVGLVSGFGFDGVTIDFDFSNFVKRFNETKERKYERSRKHYVQSYLLFLKQLSKALKEQNSEIRLHAVLQYDKDTNGKLLQSFTPSELRELSDSVDLLLFIPQFSPSLDRLQAMEQYDDYFKEYSYGEAVAIEKKLVFVLDTEDAALEKELADIRSDRFGGVGGWLPRKAIDAEITGKWADPVFAQSRGYVERLDSDILPGPFCKVVCPNRSILVAVIVALIATYVGAFLLSFFSPVVEKVVNAYFREVIVGALVIVFLIGSLFFCVPQWSMGWATELTVLFLLAVGGYAFNLMRTKKRETNYP